MITTFFGHDALGSSAAFVLSLLLGFGFGFALEQAGFGSSRRLAGIFYFRDMTVLRVMFTAMVTAMLGLAVGSLTGPGQRRPDLLSAHRVWRADRRGIALRGGIRLELLVPRHGGGGLASRATRCADLSRRRGLGQYSLQRVIRARRPAVHLGRQRSEVCLGGFGHVGSGVCADFFGCGRGGLLGLGVDREESRRRRPLPGQPFPEGLQRDDSCGCVGGGVAPAVAVLDRCPVGWPRHRYRDASGHGSRRRPRRTRRAGRSPHGQ